MSDSKDSPQKPDKPPLVELKNGKLVFRQKPMSLEKLSETMQEIVLFRGMLEERIEKQEPPLKTIPDQYNPLIAKLVHESEKTIQVLSKHVLQDLLPVRLEDEDENSASTAADLLSLHVVEAAIKSVATRTNYGFESNPSGGKVPNQLCIWRWEVEERNHDWLPKSLKDKLEARLLERRQVKQNIEAMFEALSLDERAALLGPKATSAKYSFKQKQPSVEPVASGSGSNDLTVPSTTKTKGKSKKAAAPEQPEKEKEKQEKKLAKAEREKKAKDAQDKSRNLMASFFGKPKALDTAESATVQASVPVIEASSSQSDFEKAFKPFALKKGAELAPINWFQEDRSGAPSHRTTKQMGRQVIIIDDDEPVSFEIEMQDSTDIGQLTAQERLNSILASLSRAASTSHHIHPSQTSNFKSTSRRSVREILTEISEAEISGDASVVRSLVGLLRDRSLIPVKVLIFAEDSRPGYLGTWTRNSTVVGPRTPFARDTVALDYSYDSGEDWEEEDPGEADDVVEGNEDEDQDDGKDSDVDSWLVDDDEEVELEVSSDREVSPAPVYTKRKATVSELAKPHKKRKVVPLVPFIKGPSWETSVGKSPDIFNPYRIRLFNDTPCPVDPFTHTSIPSEVKNKKSSDPRFAVPALPDRILSSSNSNSNPPLPTTLPGHIKKPAAPKQPFPDTHVPALVAKINTLATGSLMLIVEAVYQELKDQKVKKNSIEAKVKELASKENKIWVVKAAVPVPS